MARVEILLAACLALAVTCLILLNVVTRAFNIAIYWVDEAAIYAMIWMTLLAASAAIHHRSAIAVNLLSETMPAKMRSWLARCVTITEVIFALVMLWLCARWYQPFDLLAAGFDRGEFQSATFNFIYSEPTTTLRFPKFWIWLIMWIFALGALLHSIANLFGDGTRETVEP